MSNANPQSSFLPPSGYKLTLLTGAWPGGAFRQVVNITLNTNKAESLNLKPIELEISKIMAANAAGGPPEKR